MTEARKEFLDKLMKAIPIAFRYYWCEAKCCACLGCANMSGGLRKAGYSKEDWENWVKEHPELMEIQNG